MIHKIFSLCLIASVAIFNGCAHIQLRKQHASQAKTLTNVFEQQVLDNLAMFAKNEFALPFFAVPSAGATKLTDNQSLGVSTLNGPGESVLGPLGIGRQNSFSWNMTPITDPGKLAKMQKAYQEAICTLDYEICAKKAVCRCDKVGHYCDTTIRICPDSYGRFYDVVNKIMEIALKEAASPKTKQVKLYLDESGFPTDPDKAELVLEAKVRVGLGPMDTRSYLGLPDLKNKQEIQDRNENRIVYDKKSFTDSKSFIEDLRKPELRKSFFSPSPFDQQLHLDLGRFDDN